ncbi:MAG: 23S rRNA (pseudouridine(1915)-N(3))-methyltransferase RlmH [Lachnospiraceae bacterium]|jgi:23S rRNA (pseudouridine1915-N3)-methyltransferase|nr:23S rRNA (pseudouridine(1915)-N(3))-methyltransferase RlmH [Lachnospiraceae bacterium]
MKFRIICVGKVKEGFYRDLIKEKSGAFQKMGHTLEIIELPDTKIPEKMSESATESFLVKECEPMLSKLSNRDYVIALCVEGKEISAKEHCTHIKKAMELNMDSVTYIIGGSLGIAQKIKDKAKLKLSFSKMTFPHQIMRMVLVEALCDTVTYL